MRERDKWEMWVLLTFFVPLYLPKSSIGSVGSDIFLIYLPIIMTKNLPTKAGK